MYFWLIAASMTLVASLAVLLPLVRGAVGQTGTASHDLEVYRDQLAEVERDARRGVIGAVEAEEARAEIARRILRLDQAAEPAVRGRAPMIASLAVLAVPVIAWGLYAELGSPGLPSQPLSARQNNNLADMRAEELVARAEAHMRANPDDGKGWDLLAPIYVRLGRGEDAVTAFRNSIRLNGATAEREAGLGEAIAVSAGGTISDAARAAFTRALELDPRNPKAAFFLANALAQDGKFAEAAQAWRTMLLALPTSSPWRGPTEQAIAETERQASAGGPSKADVEAASQMSEQDRNAMISSMVEGLDRKLRENPRDMEGWQRLIRSYQVLARPDDAREALGRAIAAFGTGSAEASRLQAFAASLGLSTTE